MLTLVFGFFYQLSNHSLDNTDVPVQKPSQSTAGECDPKVGSQPNYQKGQYGAKATRKENRLATDSVRQTSPEHAGEGFCERKGRDENAGIERGISAIRDVHVLDHHPRVREDGGQGDGLRDATYC